MSVSLSETPLRHMYHVHLLWYFLQLHVCVISLTQCQKPYSQIM